MLLISPHPTPSKLEDFAFFRNKLVRGLGQLLLLCTTLLIMPAPCLFATQATDSTIQNDTLSPAYEFQYTTEGRHDPFIPFLKVKSIHDDELVDDDGENLTGLRRFEPRQLTLVAILTSNGEQIAMAQDGAGIGYTLREGMKIGRRGVIERISDGAVQIRESAKTRAGKEIVQAITMRFNKDKDGEK